MQLIKIALLFKQGQQQQHNAAQALRKTYRSRDAAKEAMLQPMAKAYGVTLTLTEGGVARWDSKDKDSGAAKKALNRLLALAYTPKKPQEQRGKTDPVKALLKKYAALTEAQQARFKKAVR